MENLRLILKGKCSPQIDPLSKHSNGCDLSSWPLAKESIYWLAVLTALPYVEHNFLVLYPFCDLSSWPLAKESIYWLAVLTALPYVEHNFLHVPTDHQVLIIDRQIRNQCKSTKVLQGSLFRGRILFLGQVSVDIYGCQKAGLEGWFRRLWQCNFLLLISSMIMQSTKQSSLINHYESYHERDT
ncbi:hypothetical protein YC2023_070971 [Brassica napus]